MSMSRATRFGVLGLYRSGSTAVAGALHHLGVDMGAPYWGDYYEPYSLSEQLRAWWREPFLEQQVDRSIRVRGLRRWMEDRELSGSSIVGCKHPLLCLCGEDLVEAWGPEARFIWTFRPLEDSMESIVRWNWWPTHGKQMQLTLWEAIQKFFAGREHLRIEFAEMMENPQLQMQRIVEYLGLEPTDEQFATAVGFIRPRDKTQPAPLQSQHESQSIHPAHVASLNASVMGGQAAVLTAAPGRSIASRRSRAVPAGRSQSTVHLPAKQPDPTNPTATEKIIATMLCGNNQEIVADAVRSVIDWVDEFLLIDTGITDDSAKIVQELAGEKFRQTRFTWCNDFALARNTSLREAAERGATWALTVDTDERVTIRDFTSLEELRQYMRSEPKVLTWMVTARGGGYSKERLIRVPTHLEWKGRTHEALVGASAQQRKVLPGATFHETPKTPEAFQKKLERDLVILNEETRDHPDKPRWWYFLGQTLDVLGRKREAVDALQRCIALDGWAEENAWACYLAGKSLIELKEYRKAIEIATRGLGRQPGSPELAWMAGFCCFELGEYQNAIHWSKIAILLGNVEGIQAGAGRISFRFLPGWYEEPYDVLRFAYRKLGMESEAREAEAQYHRARAMRTSGKTPGAEKANATGIISGPDTKNLRHVQREPQNNRAIGSSGEKPATDSLEEFRRAVMQTKTDDLTKLTDFSQQFHDSADHLRNSGFFLSDGAYNLTVSHDRRFIWFRVAKVATRTILNHFREHCAPLDMDHSMAIHYPVNLCRDYFKFAFVRNPWERLVSSWQNKIVDTNFFRLNKSTRQRLMEFANFVDYVRNLDIETCDHHFRLQCTLIDLNQLDFLGRHESFGDDFSHVCQVLGVPELNGEQRNKSGRLSDHRQYYTPELVASVAKIYQKDIQVFKYSFE